MNNKEIAEQIKSSMSSGRYQHTMGVVETAVKLAELYGAEREKARIAALLHDIAREFGSDRIRQLCQQSGIAADEVEKAVPDLLHGKLAAHIAAKNYGVRDGEILDAIRFHTTGRRKMTVLDKIIFIADMIEPGRDFPGVQSLRELAWQDLDRAVVAGLDNTIRYVLDRGLLIHPNSIEARNELLDGAHPVG